MITYDLSLERQNLLGADKFSIAAESNETISFRFHFDRNWRIFDTKAAVFKSADNKYYVLDIKGTCVTVPWEVLRSTHGFEIAVVAYENEVVLTSKKVEIAVSSTLLPEKCKQLSPTETLFGRLIDEAKNAAFLEYKDEIKSLKRTHTNELLELGERIEEERQSKVVAVAQKNAEIEELNNQAAVRENVLQSQISALQADLAIKNPKAESWDMVNTALSQKTSSSYTLWSGGTQLFDLPQLNTSSIVTFLPTAFSSYLKSIGLDLSSATSFAGVFSNKTNLERITLINSDKITSLKDTFSGCTHLEYADLGNMSSLSIMDSCFYGCRFLKEIKFESLGPISSFAYAFGGCYALEKIDAVLDLSVCNNIANPFFNCSNLEYIRFAENTIHENIDFSYCPNLTKESIYSIANGLSSDAAGDVTFAETVLYNALSAAERSEINSIIRNKDWTISLE